MGEGDVHLREFPPLEIQLLWSETNDGSGLREVGPEDKGKSPYY